MQHEKKKGNSPKGLHAPFSNQKNYLVKKKFIIYLLEVCIYFRKLILLYSINKKKYKLK